MWQPIETAPKEEDNQKVLLWDGENVSVGYLGFGGWFGLAAGQVAMEDEQSCIRIYPTHWKPLPEPPPSDFTDGEAT